MFRAYVDGIFCCDFGRGFSDDFINMAKICLGGKKHGSSEGHFMLKRHDICCLIADVELIPKMCFLRKSVHDL